DGPLQLIRPFRCGKSSHGKEKRRGGISRQAKLGKGEQWADETFSPSQGGPSSTKRPHEGGDHKERATERAEHGRLCILKFVAIMASVDMQHKKQRAPSV